MQVFIVRPFGVKKVFKDQAVGGTPIEINFDKVHTELIEPALAKLELEGGTTGKIFEPGDIREDMFSLLLRADLVIADITIHNANVFYELGIRHALRDKKTILIKAPGVSDTPFDILGYKYLSYDKENPAAVLPDMIQTIIDTNKTSRVDSPVFKVLPGLKPPDYEKFIAVPAGFIEEVRMAAEGSKAGKLSLLAYEADSFEWRIPAFRFIGEALYQQKEFDSARTVWEKIKDSVKDDIQSNDRLATIYQRLGEREMSNNSAIGAELLGKSDAAIDSLLNDPDLLDKERRAEVYALKGRNTKSRWVSSWKNLPTDQRGSSALKSDQLENSYEQYLQGYYHNLNHFYAGINALSLITIQLALIEKYPKAWEAKFSKARDAEREAEDLKEKKQQLATALLTTIEAEKQQAKAKGVTDVWLNITGADYVFLTETNEDRITTVYTSALEGAKLLAYETVQRQLSIYQQLSILENNVEAVLKVIPQLQAPKNTVTHYILFTGHMIDKPDRKEPRFPADKESVAREKIKALVEKEIAGKDKQYRGIAGGACGGDILFHEVCKELGVSSDLYLAIPRDDFLKTSVEFAGPQWVDRFNDLYNILPREILSDSENLPKWLEKKKNYTIWVRNNLWELKSSLVKGGMNLSLIALWDGKGGDGPGGTEHMVIQAKSKGAKTMVIDTKTL